MAIIDRPGAARKAAKPPREDDAFKDGPFKDDKWSPDGGAELYFHAHLSEPDRGLDQVNTSTLELTSWLLERRPSDSGPEQRAVEISTHLSKLRRRHPKPEQSRIVIGADQRIEIFSDADSTMSFTDWKDSLEE